jgi:hypothetical protein
VSVLVERVVPVVRTPTGGDQRAAAADDRWSLEATNDGLVRNRRTSCMACGECCLPQAK